MVTFNSTYEDMVKNNPRFMIPLNIEQNLVNERIDINKVSNAVRKFYFANESFTRHGFEEVKTRKTIYILSSIFYL